MQEQPGQPLSAQVPSSIQPYSSSQDHQQAQAEQGVPVVLVELPPPLVVVVVLPGSSVEDGGADVVDVEVLLVLELLDGGMVVVVVLVVVVLVLVDVEVLLVLELLDGGAGVVVLDVVLDVVGPFSHIPERITCNRGSQGFPIISEVQIQPSPEQLDEAIPQIPREQSLFVHRHRISHVP